MNYRLEKEIRKCLDEFINNPTRSFFEASLHYFYNLALEDVRKEVENKIKKNKENFRKGILSVEALAARDGQMMSFRDFLDNLTK